MSGVPYVGLLEGREAAQVIAETPMRLGLILDGLSTAEIEARPAAGKWSVREIIAHLADTEIAWGWRLRQVYSEKHSTLQPFDQDGWARMNDAYSFELAWATFKALRAWNLAFIGGLTEEDKKKVYTHPERGGEETLGLLLEIMAGHDLHHLAGLKRR